MEKREELSEVEKAVSFEMFGKWVLKIVRAHYWYVNALKSRAVKEREKEIQGNKK